MSLFRLPGGLPVVIVLLGTSCLTFEGSAQSRLKEQGCSNITLERTGLQSFSYQATCERQYCSGSMEFGSSSTSSKICSSTPPATMHIEGAGQVRIGRGNVTGLCSADAVRIQMTQALPELKACYDRDLVAFPDLTGTMNYVWEIDGQGKATVQDLTGDLPMVDCTRDILAKTTWQRPERRTCLVRWTVGYFTDEPPSDLGHDRLPAAPDCTNPLSMQPGPGQKAIPVTDLVDALGGDWQLQDIELWTGGALNGVDTKLLVLADQVSTPVGHRYEGPVAGRQTLLCHTQPLKMTITTSTDENGKKVKTKRLAGDDAVKNNGSATFPITFSLDDNTAAGLRHFEFDLLNGKFVPKLYDTPLPDGSTFSSLFEGDATAKIVAIQRSPDRLDMVLGYQTAEFEMLAQASYRAVER